MAETVREKDGLDVTIGGTFSRHGIAIVSVAILGAAVGAATGYAIAMHTGMSKSWAMGIGGFAGFAVAGGVTYAVFHSIDAAELAAEKYVDERLKAAKVDVKPATTKEAAKKLVETMQEATSQFKEIVEMDAANQQAS